MKIRHSGDFGDLIYSLAILQAIGGWHEIYGVNRPGVTAAFTPRVAAIKPLAESQPYVSQMICSEEEVDVDLVPFRRFHSSTTTLIQAQSAEFQVQSGILPKTDGSKPWLVVEPDPDTKGRVIIGLTERYRNEFFPWREIIQHFGDRLLFVGLPWEHEMFKNEFGKVDYLQVRDFLHMAQAIMGAGFYIGNQSSPMAVAMGLGVQIIQMCCNSQPDCIFNRKNVQYVSDGSCELPDIGNGITKVLSKLRPNTDVSRATVPPGHWQYPGLPDSCHFGMQMALVKKLENCTDQEADLKLVLYNIARLPEYFQAFQNNPKKLVDEAISKAYSNQIHPK